MAVSQKAADSPRSASTLLAFNSRPRTMFTLQELQDIGCHRGVLADKGNGGIAHQIR